MKRQFPRTFFSNVFPTNRVQRSVCSSQLVLRCSDQEVILFKPWKYALVNNLIGFWQVVDMITHLAGNISTLAFCQPVSVSMDGSSTRGCAIVTVSDKCGQMRRHSPFRGSDWCSKRKDAYHWLGGEEAPSVGQAPRRYGSSKLCGNVPVCGTVDQQGKEG